MEAAPHRRARTALRRRAAAAAASESYCLRDLLREGGENSHESSAARAACQRTYFKDFKQYVRPRRAVRLRSSSTTGDPAGRGPERDPGRVVCAGPRETRRLVAGLSRSTWTTCPRPARGGRAPFRWRPSPAPENVLRPFGAASMTVPLSTVIGAGHGQRVRPARAGRSESESATRTPHRRA